jgi:hypothetical protein
MRRIHGLLAAIAVLGIGLAHAQMPDHPHMLVQSPVFEFNPVIEEGVPVALEVVLVGWRKCVDLAGGRSVPLRAHHDTLHLGTAGDKLRENANTYVVPTSPLAPWANCADFAGLLPLVVDVVPID